MSFKTLLAHEVQEFLLQEDIVVLDHRDTQSYQKAHLSGAMQVSDPLIMKLIKMNKDSQILVYCYRGNSSKDLATLLINLGLKNVYNLEGGWLEWSKHEQKQSPNKAVSTGLKEWLIDQKFEFNNINYQIDNGMSALMQAALLAETSYVQELIDLGIQVNMLNDDENNALWFACVSEDLDIINILIENDININNKNVNGASALIYAASSGKFNVVKALVEAGANITDTTLDGFNALDSASTIEILKYLKPQYIAA